NPRMRVRQRRRDPARSDVSLLDARLNPPRNEGEQSRRSWRWAQAAGRKTRHEPPGDHDAGALSREIVQQHQQFARGVRVAPCREVVDENKTWTCEQGGGHGESRERVSIERVDTTMRDGRQACALERVSDTVCTVLERKIANDGRVLHSLSDREKSVRKRAIAGERDAVGAHGWIAPWWCAEPGHVTAIRAHQAAGAHEQRGL